MSSRKTLKSVSVEGMKPTVTLTPVIEPCGEGCRIHHIKSDSIARDGRDTFVPLRHVSKQKRRIFELEDENAKLRKLVNSYADSFERDAAMNNGCGPYYSGEDWLALANDMRIELAECCGELGVEVD